MHMRAGTTADQGFEDLGHPTDFDLLVIEPRLIVACWPLIEDTVIDSQRRMTVAVSCFRNSKSFATQLSFRLVEVLALWETDHCRQMNG